MAVGHGDDIDCWRDRATMMLVVGRVAEETTMTINVIGNYSNKGINNSGCVSDDDNDANDSSSCKIGNNKDYRKAVTASTMIDYASNDSVHGEER